MTIVYILIGLCLLLSIYNFIMIVGLSNFVEDLIHELEKKGSEYK